LGVRSAVVIKDFKDRTAVVGVGNTNFGAMYRDLDRERSPYTLGAYAFKEALADAGLATDDVDGVLVCRIPDYARMCDVLGIRYPRFTNVFQGAGRMAGLTIQTAAMAVYTGMADVVACIYGNNGKSVGARYGGGEGGDSETAMYDAVYGMTSPGASVAHMYQRYRWLYNPPEEALAHLAINNRENAMLNPAAVMRRSMPVTSPSRCACSTTA
jgi:acetyl-CoA acetyltransferase